MELSVASRVKAHVSTSYIDADNRGTQYTYAADYADCMKSPAEFAKIQSGAGDDQVLLLALEAQHAAIMLKSKTFQESLRIREADRLQDKMADAAQLAQSLDVKRERQRGEEQKKESAKLDDAYHRRLESDEAMARFEGLLRESAEAKLRRKEVEVRGRHDRLAAMSQRSRDDQARVVQQQRQRDLHIKDIEERMVRADAEARARDDAARAAKEVAEATASAIREREMMEQVASDVAALRAAAAAEEARMASIHRRLVSEEQQALHLLDAQVKQQHHLAMRHTQGSIEQTYGQLRSLQLDHEMAAQLLQLELDKLAAPHGRFLDVLMGAARAPSEAGGSKLYHGLDLLCNATLRQSGLTPASLPAVDADRAPKSVGTMTDAAAPKTPPVTRKK